MAHSSSTHYSCSLPILFVPSLPSPPTHSLRTSCVTSCPRTPAGLRASFSSSRPRPRPHLRPLLQMENKVQKHYFHGRRGRRRRRRVCGSKSELSRGECAVNDVRRELRHVCDLPLCQHIFHDILYIHIVVKLVTRFPRTRNTVLRKCPRRCSVRELHCRISSHVATTLHARRAARMVDAVPLIVGMSSEQME